MTLFDAQLDPEPYFILTNKTCFKLNIYTLKRLVQPKKDTCTLHPLVRLCEKTFYGYL